MTDKLVIITRDDLSKGYQIVQTAHALADFAMEHRDTFVEWRSESAYLCCLVVPNRKALLDLRATLKEMGIKHSVMYESDLEGQETAIAVQPLPKEVHKKLFGKLKLSGHD